MGRRSVGWARAGGQGRPVAPASHTALVNAVSPRSGRKTVRPWGRPHFSLASLPSARLLVAGWRVNDAGAPPESAGHHPEPPQEPPRLCRRAGDHGGSLDAGECRENGTTWDYCQEQRWNMAASSHVMAGLDPATHVLPRRSPRRGPRIKSGDDGRGGAVRRRAGLPHPISLMGEGVASCKPPHAFMARSLSAFRPDQALPTGLEPERLRGRSQVGRTEGCSRVR